VNPKNDTWPSVSGSARALGTLLKRHCSLPEEDTKMATGRRIWPLVLDESPVQLHYHDLPLRGEIFAMVPSRFGG